MKKLITIVLVLLATQMAAQEKITDIPAPKGFTRVEASGFGAYLRNLPLKPLGTPVKLFDGSVKGWQGGAYAVIDMAVDNKGNKAILVVQSYMPAQDIHIVTNLSDTGNSPWYIISQDTEEFSFPEYHFDSSHIKRFK